MEKRVLSSKENALDVKKGFIINIDSKLIVIPFPSVELRESLANYLNYTYNTCYLIFNVSEYSYSSELFFDQVVDHSFPGYPYLPLETAFTLCKEIESWINSSKHNVAVVHCQASKVF